MSVLGFTIKSAANGNEDFIPIVKYDARAGRMFRVDRQPDTNGQYYNENVDITMTFKAVVDFEGIETGWLAFSPGQAPSFAMIPIASISPQNPLPARPSPNHKEGVRFMLKLSKACGGDKPVREIAGTSKAFLAAIESIYTEYLRDREQYPGQLPVVVSDGYVPVKSGSGTQTSTNYHPQFRIDGWSARPADLEAKEFTARAPVEPLPAVTHNLGRPTGALGAQPPVLRPPATGSTPVAPPQRKQPVMPAVVKEDEEDFG